MERKVKTGESFLIGRGLLQFWKPMADGKSVEIGTSGEIGGVMEKAALRSGAAAVYTNGVRNGDVMIRRAIP